MNEQPGYRVESNGLMGNYLIRGPHGIVATGLLQDYAERWAQRLNRGDGDPTDAHAASALEFCPRCGSGPRQQADTVDCPDCGYVWAGPRLLDSLGPQA